MTATAISPTPQRELLHYYPGPAAVEFHNDTTRIRGLRGPIRTGKSVTCSVEGLDVAKLMWPCKDGIKRSRFLVVRNTYGQLFDTTIKTFLQWIPEETYGKFRETPYPNYDIKLRDERTGKLLALLEVWFRALDRPEHLRNLLSMEYTFFWANEARELKRQFIEWLDSRAGQYPPKILKPDDVPDDKWPRWYGGWMDTNSPDEGHWWHRLFEELCNPEHPDYDRAVAAKYKQFFFPRENNEHNLPANYYRDLAVGKTPEWVKVYVRGEYGFVLEGKAVYPDYSDPYHCAGRNYNPPPGSEILRGWDIGNTVHPGVVLAQLNNGLEVFDELVLEDVGIHRCKDLTIEYCGHWYPDCSFRDFGDPAMLSTAAGDKEERTTQQIMAGGDHPIYITPGHIAFTGRREAVKKLLVKTVPAYKDQPVMSYIRISERCRILRNGFKGGYHYQEIGNTGRYHPKPVKDVYSCPHDALQYLVTGLFSPYEERAKDKKKKGYTPRRPPSAMAA